MFHTVSHLVKITWLRWELFAVCLYTKTRNPQRRLRRLATARPAGGSRSLRSLGWLASLAFDFAALQTWLASLAKESNLKSNFGP